MTKKETVIKALRDNHFEVFSVSSPEEAKQVFIEKILTAAQPATISYGDSETMRGTGVINYLKNCDHYTFIDTFDKNDTWRTQIHKRKQALTADMFLAGTNAITLKGQLVNLDMIGNRIAAMTFGPRHVVLFCGMDKVVDNLDEAMRVIQEIRAPLNAQRHADLNTPCQFDGKCHHCKSPHRICNAWSIIEKSYPKHRIKIVLMDANTLHSEKI